MLPPGQREPDPVQAASRGLAVCMSHKIRLPGSGIQNQFPRHSKDIYHLTIQEMFARSSYCRRTPWSHTSWKTDTASCRARDICCGNPSLAGRIRESGLRLKDCIPCARLSTSPCHTLSSERSLSGHSRRFSILHDFIRH